MNVANLELCKQLFELSGWHGTERYWYKDWLKQESWQIGYLGQADETTIPAYDLGYLLRNLPQNSWIGYVDTSGRRDYALAKMYAWNKDGNDIEKVAENRADTPEDAACQLAIELFRRGMLKRG